MLALLRSVAFAQTTTPEPVNAALGEPPNLTRQQLNPSQETERPKRRRSADLFSAPAAEDCPLRDSAIKFTLRSVTVQTQKNPDLAAGAAGADLAPPAVVSDLTSDMVGKEIAVSDLCGLRDRISDYLFYKRNILARVLIPEQKIAGGQVQFLIIPADIISVRYHGDIGPAQAKVEAYLDHLRGLAPFDLDVAQRYLLLANDVPGVQATARLTHSATSADPGGLDLDITLVREAVDEVGAAENTGSKTQGPYSGIARVDLNSFTSFAERTSLIAYTTLGNTSQYVLEGIEQVRLGDNGLYVQGSFAYGASHPVGTLENLHLSSDSYVGSLEVDDPLLRLKRLNLRLAAGMDIVDQKSLASTALLSDDQLRVLWLRGQGDAQHVFNQDILGQVFTASAEGDLELRKGLDALGASKPGALALSRLEGRSDGWVVRSEGNLALVSAPIDGFGVPLSLSVHYQGQWADRPLLAYEEQEVGNLTIGRGYDPAVATGDRAIAAEVKLAAGPFPVIRDFAFQPYGFLDTARVTSLEPGSSDITLRSIGAGVEFRLPFHGRADVYYAQPLDKVSLTASSKPSPQILFQIVFAH